MTDIDAKLKSLFAATSAPTDEIFVKRVDCAVAAEKKMIAAQAAMRRRFARELAATIAVVVTFYLLWRNAPSGGTIEPMSSPPGIAASLMLFLWLGVQLKQSAAAR